LLRQRIFFTRDLGALSPVFPWKSGMAARF
jgi:hypothetical protein